MIACTGCGAANRAGRRFCADCGVALPIACPTCGFVNEPEEKFCGGCGAALTAANAPSEQMVKAAGGNAAAEAERRPITVLFADLTGFTRLSQELDPEEVHRLLERYFQTVDDIVEQAGGSIDKHMGDSVMGVFGAPVAHGDEGARAVRAAARIHGAVEALGDELARPLEVHIGIASGQVIASGLGSGRHRVYTVIGNSVNLAARLLQLAGPGETVLDDAVHAAVLGIARCEQIDDARVKGIDAPLRVWRLLDVGEGTAADAQPFVGRQGELAQLTALLRNCATSRRGGAVLVRGDAGLGKSRLIGELRRAALTEGFACHTGLVLDFGIGKGRDAIRELVAGMLGLAPHARADDRLAALERIMPESITTLAQHASLIDLLDLPQPAATRGLYEGMDHLARARGRTEAFIGLAQQAGAQRPLLLIVEDLHWADRMTLNHLAALTRATMTLPIVLAMTTRPEGDPLDSAWRATTQGAPLATIDLGPLQAHEALALASGLYATSQHFAQQCIDRAAGNPLFLEQLLRAADEHEDALPASLHSLVLARVDRLPERDRAALRAAAVIGQRFSLSLVRQLANIADYDCTNLVTHTLVRPDGDEWLFGHALIRDGVYASLTRTRRAELHRAAAAWFDARDPTLSAQHLDRADAPEAARAYLLAARAQATALRLERALALAERGALLARERADIHALNMLRGELLREIGDGKPAIDAYQAALAAADAALERCRALLGIAAGERLIAGVDAALAALAQAETFARDEEPGREWIELHATRGNLRFAQGRIVECRSEHTIALKHARELGDSEWEARALSGLADADYLEGRMRTAHANFQACLALCDRHGHARIAIANRVMVGHCLCYLTEFDASLALMQSAADAAVQSGNRHAEMFALQSYAYTLTNCARFDEAAPYQVRSRALAETLGARRYLAVINAHEGECLIADGRIAEARELLTAGLALARETAITFAGPYILGLLAGIAENAATREACQAEAEALLTRRGHGHSHFAYHRLAIDDAIARSDWPRALEQAAALADFTQAEPVPYCDFLIARGRALAALGQHPQDAGLRAEVSALRAHAERLHWPIHWPEWALAGTTSPT
ncbi:MAG: adenylate/guanylate cyclase domain-containing protein [Casimicrobiaceae bacterium]